jgi:hypothetical protein
MSARVCLLHPASENQRRSFCFQVILACIALLLCFPLPLTNAAMPIDFLLSVFLLMLLSWCEKGITAEKNPFWQTAPSGFPACFFWDGWLCTEQRVSCTFGEFLEPFSLCPVKSFHSSW